MLSLPAPPPPIATELVPSELGQVKSRFGALVGDEVGRVVGIDEGPGIGGGALDPPPPQAERSATIAKSVVERVIG